MPASLCSLLVVWTSLDCCQLEWNTSLRPSLTNLNPPASLIFVRAICDHLMKGNFYPHHTGENWWLCRQVITSAFVISGVASVGLVWCFCAICLALGTSKNWRAVFLPKEFGPYRILLVWYTYHCICRADLTPGPRSEWFRLTFTRAAMATGDNIFSKSLLKSTNRKPASDLAECLIFRLNALRLWFSPTLLHVAFFIGGSHTLVGIVSISWASYGVTFSGLLNFLLCCVQTPFSVNHLSRI